MRDPRPRTLPALVSIVIVVVIAAAGCGPSAHPGESGPFTTAPAQPVTPRECEVLAYPCSLGAVAADVTDRSRTLGRDAASRLHRGESSSDVAAWLEAQEGVLTVDADAEALRFRLDGGRFVWVMPKEARSAPAAGGLETVGRAAGGPFSTGNYLFSPRRDAPLPVGGTGIVPGSVVGEGRGQKTAVILSPYWYEFDEKAMGTDLTTLLNGTRGYAGGVTYRRNATATSTDVDVNAFAHLAGNDVIYIDSIGGTICRGEGDAQTCYGVIAAHDIFGSDEAREAQVEGLDSIVWFQGGEAVGLSADFFATYYPGGIGDALIFVGGADMGEGTLIEALIRSTSEIFYWDGERDAKRAADVVYRFIARLAETGRTTASVYHEMVDELVVDGARYVNGTRKGSGEHTARLREVVVLRDPATGEPLEDGDSIEIDGTLDDGQSDLIPYMVDVEGLDPGDEDSTSVHVTIDGMTIDHLVSDDATRTGDDAWRVEAGLSHEDLHEGEQLSIDALVQLPEGGYSRQVLNLTVTGDKQPEIGRVWEGTASTRIPVHGGDAAVTISVSVRLVRDPSDEPVQKHISFVLERGTMRWAIGGSSDECSFSGGPVEVEMPETEFDVITFHRPDEPGGPITYDGIGEFDDGPSVTVRQDCETVDVEYEADAEGTWLYAPRDAGFILEGDIIEGSYDRYSWSFHRVE